MVEPGVDVVGVHIPNVGHDKGGRHKNIAFDRLIGRVIHHPKLVTDYPDRLGLDLEAPIQMDRLVHRIQKPGIAR